MGRVVTNPTGSVVDASEVKILYESNENTNAYTDGDKASLGEVKDAIDMAKKVIEITFLLNDWTSNSDGTYSQTVNNSEIKSSMNPDLISMLSSGATPEEQKTYMKNFSILCQSVGNTANGSVTYNIYKQMTGDITVGLTRLGGVKQIESGAKVDDVKVGGVSVVKDKVAEIPAIPDITGLVPYSGATKDINVGNHAIDFNTTGSLGDLSASATINVGKFASGASSFTPGISIDAEAHSDNPYLSDSFNLRLSPTGLSIDANHLDDDSGNNTSFEVRSDGFSIRRGLDTEVKITADKVTGLALPTVKDDAANKEYVDNKVESINIPVFSTGSSATMPPSSNPLVIDPNRIAIVSTSSVPLSSGSKVIGILSVGVRAKDLGALVGSVGHMNELPLGGYNNVAFDVVISNPLAQAVTIENVTVQFTYA